MKAARERMQPPRRHLPIRVAARAVHEIELAFGAFQKPRPQFAVERPVVASGGRQCGFEGP
jgi:hypothetical protein